MLELAGQIGDVVSAGRAVAVATVVGINGSAPRNVGATMFVDETGAVVGSVSGGCVESAVVEVCHAVLDGAGPTVVRFGISDESAMGVGLTCGGDLDVFVRRLDDESRGAAAAAETDDAAAGRAAAIATIVAGPPAILGASLGRLRRPDDLSDAQLLAAGISELSVARIEAELDARARSGRPGILSVDCGDSTIDVFFDVSLPPARMLIFGAVDFSAALADAAQLLGYHVTVCDARDLFATAERFPRADEVVAEWPHNYLARTQTDERSVVCVLTHDPKFDIPLLQVALALPVAYVGAMGSRRTHESRVQALTDAGVPADEIDRLHSPIGLDIGAGTSQETAISILAEVIAARTGASGARLRDAAGPIHRTRALVG